MGTNDINRIRVLAEVLSIDAWHEPFRTDGTTSSVHVEVRFENGRLGGDKADWPFTFNLALRRAVLTVQLEAPLRLDRKSVARPKPVNDGERTKVFELRKSAKFNAEAQGRITPNLLPVRAGASASGSTETETTEKVRSVQEIPAIMVSAIPKGESGYAWELTPGMGTHLVGQPWNPIEEPRLSVKSVDDAGRLERVIKVTLTCAIDDLEITDLKPKHSSVIETIKDVAFNNINKAAAVQYLKVALMQADLEVGLMDNRFAEVVLADLISAVDS